MEIEVNGDRLETNPVDIVRNQCRLLSEHIERRHEESVRSRKRLEGLDMEIAKAMAERDRMLEWIGRNGLNMGAQNNVAAAQSSCGKLVGQQQRPAGTIMGLGDLVNCRLGLLRQGFNTLEQCQVCGGGPCKTGLNR